jgi:hypothetical protein
LEATDVIERLAELLDRRQQAADPGMGFGFKHDASGTPIAVGYSHGPGGNFSFPGVDNQVFHTVVGNIGILGRLPASPSVQTDPTYAVLTGVQDVSGTEKDGVCDDARTAGLIKNCIITSPFGRYELATAELELNRLGQVNDRADPMDLALVGSPIHQSGIFASGARKPATPANLLRNEVAAKFWELNIGMHRLISQQLWIGDPANNAAGGGYKEITSFSQLINTGYVDVQSNAACPSVDSDLKDFGCTNLEDDTDRLIEMLSNIIRTRRDLAFRTGVSPVRFLLAMRPELFWVLTSVYACSYLTYRCQVTGQERVVVEGSEQVAFRDAMRTGRYLLVDGERIEVVLDDGIAVDTPTTNSSVTEGCQCSDIYLIPMSVMGGRAVTFLEYMDYGNPAISQALGNLVLARREGAFLTWPRQTNQCVVWQTKTEPRLVMRTPWLAGRIQNIEYCPTQNARTPFPDDPYNIDGGAVNRPGPSHYALWQD